MTEKPTPADEDILAGRNPENIAMCNEVGRKVARGGILQFWIEYSAIPDGLSKWLKHSNYALQYAVEKMAAAGMTSAGQGAFLNGFNAEAQTFIAQRIKASTPACTRSQNQRI
jgi:hypothetical protein